MAEIASGVQLALSVAQLLHLHLYRKEKQSLNNLYFKVHTCNYDVAIYTHLHQTTKRCAIPD